MSDLADQWRTYLAEVDVVVDAITDDEVDASLARLLAGRMLVHCPSCAAPVREATGAQVLAGIGEPLHDCLFCGPAGMRRRRPTQWPVGVCVTPRWVRP